jgi:hypothetical protein
MWIRVAQWMCIYLDFQKAFDKVPHQRLLKKVQALGINGMVYTWIEDWLKNRTQRVQFGGDSSNWTSVLSGVPQGSVLGPIRFFIYINDIDDGIESKILKFADDTKLYRRITSEEDVTKLQEDLATLCKWSREWLMLFNARLRGKRDHRQNCGKTAGRSVMQQMLSGDAVSMTRQQLEQDRQTGIPVPDRGGSEMSALTACT